MQELLPDNNDHYLIIQTRKVFEKRLLDINKLDYCDVIVTVQIPLHGSVNSYI